MTVPVDEVPPTTDAGLSVSETNPGAVTPSVADWFAPFSVPVMVAVMFEATADVATVNVPVV